MHTGKHKESHQDHSYAEPEYENCSRSIRTIVSYEQFKLLCVQE